MKNIRIIPGLDIVSMSGQTPMQFADYIRERALAIEDYLVVGFAISTNRLDWARNRWGCQPENLAEQVIAETREMVSAFRQVNQKAFVILFTVIPRPRDHTRTHRACQVFNQLLYKECVRSRYGFASTWKLFAEKRKGPAQTRSPGHSLPPSVIRRDLFDDGLHLSPKGDEVLRDRLEQVFSDKSLCGSGAREA